MKKSPMFLCGLLLSFFAFQAFGQQFPVFYNQGSYTRTLVYCNVHGSGFFDYNNDGWDDIFVVQNTSEGSYVNLPNTLLKNEGRPGLGYFTNVTEQAGVVGTLYESKQGLAAGDIDNDGDIDMVIGMGQYSQGLLYLNNNNGTFSENQALIMVGGGITAYGRCVSLFDYDNDGWLDVLFEKTPHDAVAPLFALCRNRWNGYFEDRTSYSQLGSYTKADGDVYGFAIADVDNDLDLDFFVPRRAAPSLFFRNNGNGTFSEMAVGCGLPNSDYYIGAVFLDYDNDGDFDLFCKRHTFNAQLFRNEFIPTGNLSFTNVSQQAGVDIFLGNKTENTVFGGGLNTGDFNNDGYMDILSINEFGTDIFLLRNNGNGTFTDVAGYPANLKDNNRYYWTAPISDYNHDGDLDIYMGRSPQHAYDPNNPPVSEAAALYQNAYVEQGGTNKWISVRLEGGAPASRYSNWSGIGARLLGYTQGRLQMLQVLGGNGYLVNSFWNHFGLGQTSEMDSLVIYWPSGIVQRAYNIPAGTRLSISEKDSSSLYFGPLFLAGYTLYANTSSPVRQVLITMTGDSSKVKYTDVKGYYKFTPLPHGPIRLTLTATKPRGEDVDVGVISSYDAALVLQYLVGLDTLGTLQKTRGDVDQDGIITARDAFYIARYVVGITNDPGSHVGEWKFIPPSHSYTSLTKPLNSENFQASVYGDVSGNWGDPSGMPKVAFSGTPFVYVNPSKNSMEVTVGVEAFSPFLSAEFELEYDSDVLAFLGGQIAEANTGFYFVTNEIKSGLLRIALYGAHPWKKIGSIFTLYFRNLSTRSTKIQWNYAGFDEIPCRMNETQIPGLLTIQEPPPHFQLFGNYPNPFNPTTTISYRLSGSDWVRMTILSPQGREIRTLIDARQEPGVYTVVWDGRDHQGMEMASGIYLCRIKVGNSSYVHKMVKVK